MKKYLAEFSGTFLLVLVGTGAIVVNEFTAGGLGHLAVSLSFGGIVFLMVFCLGSISGAHINPAVTLAFYLAKCIKFKQVIPYILCQMLGAVLASFFVAVCLKSTNSSMGSTQPNESVLLVFSIELCITFLLMLVILVFSQNKKLEQYAAQAIGGTVFLAAYLAGPLTGASMNPARSFGPAVMLGNFSHLWIYLAAPTLGAMDAALLWNLLNKKDST